MYYFEMLKNIFENVCRDDVCCGLVSVELCRILNKDRLEKRQKVHRLCRPSPPPFLALKRSPYVYVNGR